MTQPSFDLSPSTPTSRRRWVPDTSRAAHTEAVAQGRISARCEGVLAVMGFYEALGRDPMTSAELTDDSSLERLLWMRRGLSDLLKLGMVAKAGNRLCRVTGRTCHTWRRVTR